MFLSTEISLGHNLITVLESRFSTEHMYLSMWAWALTLRAPQLSEALLKTSGWLSLSEPLLGVCGGAGVRGEGERGKFWVRSEDAGVQGKGSRYRCVCVYTAERGGGSGAKTEITTSQERRKDYKGRETQREREGETGGRGGLRTVWLMGEGELPPCSRSSPGPLLINPHPARSWGAHPEAGAGAWYTQ